MGLTILFALITVCVDQASKWLAVHYLTTPQTIDIFPPVLNATLVYNTGVAFGFLNGAPWAVPVLVLVGCVLLIIIIQQIHKKTLTHQLMCGLLLGGACGNIIDRVRLGAVIDFIDFHIWPVFNIADSCITVASIICVILLLKEGK